MAVAGRSVSVLALAVVAVAVFSLGASITVLLACKKKTYI
jgi:hypothetical protein